MNRSDEQRAAERAGSEFGRRMLDQVLATVDQAERHKLFAEAIVLCSGEPHPNDAFLGLATVVAPALPRSTATAKDLATLSARAALAGHSCACDAEGRITLARWGRCMTFGDVAAATRWLDRVAGDRA